MLYQLSYTPPLSGAGSVELTSAMRLLLRLPVQRVLPAAWAELVQLQPTRVILLVLPRAVRALLAGRARQGDHGSILGLCHEVSNVSSTRSSGHAEIGPGNRGKRRNSMAGRAWCQRDHAGLVALGPPAAWLDASPGLRCQRCCPAHLKAGQRSCGARCVPNRAVSLACCSPGDTSVVRLMLRPSGRFRNARQRAHLSWKRPIDHCGKGPLSMNRGLVA